jgi:16S rRNA pseudouridine516 synthase
VLRRVDQLLSSLGYCSRKEAQLLCDEERLVAGGQPITKASQKVDGAEVLLDGEPLDFPNGLVVMLNKPVGHVCAHDERDGRIIYELLPERWRRRDPVVTTVGRLDKDTSGLLLLTDDGPLVHRLTSPKHHVDKVYRATLDAPVTAACIEAFAQGILLDSEETKTLPAKVVAREGTVAEVTVHEGRYHQVRRMFAACGLHVTALHRESFGEFSLGELPVGHWRALRLQAPRS